MGKRILFSPVGGTDPIKYLHDGSMLHICRHYRPDEVVLYMSKEIMEKHKKDNRYVRTIELLGESINHKFDVCVVEKPDFVDVQKYDIYYDLFKNEIKNISDIMSSDDELIVNMASGTPAMKSALLILATLAEYKFIPIQVNSPKKSMNEEHEDRTDYDVEANWELDSDNEPDSENRCEEVKCMNLMRLLKIDMIKKFIMKYDYAAAFELAEELQSDISDDAYTLLNIANNRLKLNTSEISKLMKDKQYDIYPIKDSNKLKLFEYACTVKIKLEKKEYSDFIRSITPLIVDVLEQILLLKFNIDIDESCRGEKKIKKWDIIKLQRNGLLDILNEAYKDKGGFKVGPVNSGSLADIIKAKSQDEILKQKVDDIVRVEQSVRNLAAHQIVSVTAEWFIEKSGKSADDIMNIIKYLLVQAGVGAKKDDWNTYDSMNQLIIHYLE